MSREHSYFDKAKEILIGLAPPFHLPHWKWTRISILLSLDLSLVALSYWTSFVLRLDTLWPNEFIATISFTLPVVLGVHLFIFVFGGLYRPVWRFATLQSAILIARSTFLGALISLLIIYLMSPEPKLPRSIMIIYWFLSTFSIAVTRFSWRAWNDFQSTLSRTFKPTCLIYGAGKAGDLLARHIAITPKFPYHAVGFIDDDQNKRNRIIHGYKVLGTGDELNKICQQHSVHTIIIAMPSASGKIIREVVTRCQTAKVKPFILPSMADTLGENLFQPRPIDIKDLLKRAPKAIDKEAIRSFLSRKVVLVTGAGGSIGSELCRQILPCQPKALILFDSTEYNLYKIEMELRDIFGTDIPVYPVLGSVTNEANLIHVFKSFNPSIVFHAAAYKHVPILESNPIQGILNNIYGTKLLAELAIAHGVSRFLLISTDKAVNPTSIMGYTKRACELVVQSLYALNPNGCQFCAVRFGNVLGSSGSVVPRFLEQIQNGGPVTVTHPDITRYFMLTSEAVGLVLQSIAISRGGEIFVLNMGEPVKIYEMAKQLITLAGKEPGKDVEIVFTGLRPGEKLYEELIIQDTERHILHDDVHIAIPQKLKYSDILRQINELLSQALVGYEEPCVKLLKALVFSSNTAPKLPLSSQGEHFGPSYVGSGFSNDSLS